MFYFFIKVDRFWYNLMLLKKKLYILWDFLFIIEKGFWYIYILVDWCIFISFIVVIVVWVVISKFFLEFVWISIEFIVVFLYFFFIVIGIIKVFFIDLIRIWVFIIVVFENIMIKV